MSKILVVSGAYQFGDNPGLFQEAQYIGYTLDLPLRKTWIDPAEDVVSLVFETHDIETWGDWKGHKVSINGTEIGHLKDSRNSSGRSETIQIDMKASAFNSLLGGSDNFILSINLDRQDPASGMFDDFVVTRISTVNFVARVGRS